MDSSISPPTPRLAITSGGPNARCSSCGSSSTVSREYQTLIKQLNAKYHLGISIGPVPYGIAANVGASNLRVKTISLGRNTYYFLSIINTIVSPYLLNPQEANLKGKAAFPAAAFTLMLIAWTYFRLPEIKGLSQDTLNDLFQQKVPARKFSGASKRYQ